MYKYIILYYEKTKLTVVLNSTFDHHFHNFQILGSLAADETISDGSQRKAYDCGGLDRIGHL